jgi:hypothetical protein
MFIRNTLNLIENKDIEIYSCGSPNLHKFLEDEKDIKSIYQYIHYKNGKNIWVYVLCEDLSNALREWSNNKLQ